MTDRSPTDELRAEHATAIAALDALSSFVSRLSDTASAPWPGAGEVLETTANELRDILLMHFRREEEALFPEVIAVLSAGAPRVDILSQFLDGEADDDLKAHTIMRSRLKELLAIVDEAHAQGEVSPSQVQRAQATVGLCGDILRRHMNKEHAVIFPMIERLLDGQQVARVAERMRLIRQAM